MMLANYPFKYSSLAMASLLAILLASCSTPNGSFNGDLAELLVFHQALPESDRQRVERYLMDKYGLSSKRAKLRR